MSKLKGVNPVKREKRKEKAALRLDYPRSYRLDLELMGILKQKIAELNINSPRKITEARLVKALIFLSKDIENDKILKATKEVW